MSVTMNGRTLGAGERRKRPRRTRKTSGGLHTCSNRHHYQRQQNRCTDAPPMAAFSSNPSRRARKAQCGNLADDGPISGPRSGTSCLVHRLLLLLLLPPLAGSSQQVYYYATLPKPIGHIRGLRLDTPELGGERPMAAFLGIPYAGPPVGLLRFMPPGAASAAHQRPAEQCRLMPGGQLAQVRPHGHFGRQCVHLSDWLEPATTSRGAQEQVTAEAANDTRSAARSSQSEDCLNLNAFVPINESNSNNNNTKSMRQQIKSSQASQQQQQQPELTSGPASGRQQPLRPDNQQLQQQQQANGSDPLNQAAAATTKRPVWPLPRGEDNKLPVLVLVHTATDGRQNSLAYLRLAQSTNSLVVTFNFRQGLLGFLPYSTANEPPTSAGSGGPTSGSSGPSSSSGRWLARNNHAIWDQVGLLHWLNRNIVHLNGDPRNVTLLPADNQANQLVQLLSMSPLAKGLFNRIVLAHEQSSGSAPDQPLEASSSALGTLLARANEARRSRRLLSSALNRLVEQMAAPKVAANKQESGSAQALEFLQAANLSQLARLELGLAREFSRPLLALTTGPALDDRLLFPQLSALAALQSAALEANLESLGAQLRYCHYMRQLYANGPDPLGLVSGDHNSTSSGSLVAPTSEPELGAAISGQADERAGSWRRDVNATMRPSSRADSESGNLRQTAIVANFEHLHKLHLLAKLLGLVPSSGETDSEGRPESLASGGLSALVDDEDDEEEDEDDFSELSRRQQGRTVLAAHGAAIMRRRQVDTNSTTTMASREAVKRSASDPVREELGQLLELLGSFDLMLGYFRTSREPNKAQEVEDQTYEGLTNGSFTNISNILRRVWLSNSDDLQLVRQVSFVELHHLATLLSPLEASSQYCDLFSTKPPPTRAGFVFMIADSGEMKAANGSDGKQNYNWLIDSMEKIPSLSEGLSNFIHFGFPNNRSNGGPNNQWPIYDSLKRKLRRLSKSNDSMIMNYPSKLKNQLALSLDVIPYLDQLKRRNRTTGDGPPWDRLSQVELVACIQRIDNAMGTIPRQQLGDSREISRLMDNALSGEAQCLLDYSSKFRGLLRQYAFEDLEPLNRLQAARSSLKNSSRSIIATRNLVSADSTADLQQLDQPQIQGQTNAVIPFTTLTGSNNKGSIASTVGGPILSLSSGGRTSDSMVGGFFARLYRDAAGQALALVVGCGLLVFLVNLAIVVIITIRALRARRRVSGQQRDETEFPVSIEAQQEQRKEQQQQQDSTLIGNKRSSLKRHDGNQIEFGTNQRLQLANKANGQSHTCTFKTKQLKFDLSGIESTKLDKVEASEEARGQTSPERGQFYGQIPARRKQPQERPMVFVSSASDYFNENLYYDFHKANGSDELAEEKMTIYKDCPEKSPIVECEPIFRELEPEQLDIGWQDDVEPIYLKHQITHNHPHLHHYNQHQGHEHQPEGSLNSSGFGPHSSTTSTTNGGLNEVESNYQQTRQQFEGGGHQHSYFVAQASPDSSATLSVTPIRLESFAAPTGFALSPDSHQQRTIQLFGEPIGVLYPATGFDSGVELVESSSEQVSSANGTMLMVASHQHQTNPASLFQQQQQQQQQQLRDQQPLKASSFCSRHQRL